MKLAEFLDRRRANIARINNDPKMQMMAAMGALKKPMYEGTASPHKVAANRRRNKAARAARRVHRSRR